MSAQARAAAALRKRLDHRGLPVGSTSPYAGLSERDINATGPLEQPIGAPLGELPETQPHEVAVAQQELAAQQRPGSVPAQVGNAVAGQVPRSGSVVAPIGVSAIPQAYGDDADLEAARVADRESRFAAGMELAGRQLVGGITRTPVPQGLGANPSEVPVAMARAKSKREQAAAVLAARRQSTMDASTLDLQKSQAEKNRREKADGAGELESYKTVMSRRYPEAAELIAGLTTMKGAQDLQNSLDSEAGRKTTIEAARIAAGASRSEARSVREDTKEAKATETEAEQAIPGHVHDPKIKVPPPKVSALRDGIADAATMHGHIAELDALVAKHGLEVVPGPVKTRMEALVRQLGIKAKGPAFAELGVLAGPDLQILDDMIGDPTNWRTVFKGGADDVRARLGVFRDAVKTNMANKKRLYGYSEAGPRRMKLPSGEVVEVE